MHSTNQGCSKPETIGAEFRSKMKEDSRAMETSTTKILDQIRQIKDPMKYTLLKERANEELDDWEKPYLAWEKKLNKDKWIRCQLQWGLDKDLEAFKTAVIECKRKVEGL